MKKTPLVILTSLLLTGCVHDYQPPEPPLFDPSGTKIAEASVSVSSSLQTLEGIRKAENPDYAKNLPSPRTYGMNYLASIDWTGPIGPLVERIAEAAGYNVRVLGSPPEIPIIVQLSERNTPLSVILRDADYQAGTKADIVVYASRHVIELRYRNFNPYDSQ